MPSPKDQNDPQSQHPEELNPFVAFRRFADEQIASFWHNVLGLPLSSPSSTIPSVRQRDENLQMELVQHEERQERSLEQARRRVEDSLAKAPNEKTEFPPAPIDENSHDYRQAAGIGNIDYPREPEELKILAGCVGRIIAGLQKLQFQREAEATSSAANCSEQEHLRCPYRPVDQACPLQSQMSESSSVPTQNTDSPFPPFSAFGFRRFMHRGINGYLLWSPYSPLHLEQDPILGDYHVAWQCVFGDLMGTGIVRDLRDHDNSAEGLSGYCRNARKLLQLYDGLQGPLFPCPGDIMDVPNPDEEAGLNECAELDLCERFLGAQDPQGTSDQPASPPKDGQTPPYPEPAALSSPVDTPSLTSTLTTTERNTLADGSVHTKIVLKKRFADGREESTETVHTTYGSPVENRGNAKAFLLGEAQDPPSKKGEGIAQQARKKGWFWS